MKNDIWPLVHAERAALIADLEDVDDTRWELPSLCDGWSVHDVVAHLVDTARTTRLRFVVDMLRMRFDFDRQNELGLVRGRGATPRQTLDGLRAVASITSTPPAPIITRLVEEVLHGEDVRRPLGITRSYPHDAVVGCLRHLARTSASFGGAKDRIAGIRLTATDVDLSLGTGPDVRGPALALLLAASGRPVAMDELDGPGVATLKERG